jgi:fructan beta-fructosidase
MAFSGSAVIDWQNTSGLGKDGKPPMIALFTGYNPVTHAQAQYLAASTDRGRTFTRYGTGPVLDIGSTEFRDPKVFWHAATKRWVMLVVLALDNKIAVYTSPDLKVWGKASEFGPAGARGKNWECPDLFELPVEGHPGETRWVLSVNLGDNAIGGGSGGQYFVGSFDGRSFTPDPTWGPAPVWMDNGADFYAAVSWNDIPASDGRRILIGWASDWRYANALPATPARGLMSLPRSLTLRHTPAGYRLAQVPVREVEALRRDHRSARDIVLGPQPVNLPVTGSKLELQLELEPGSANQITITLTDSKGYRSVIGVNPAASELFFDRTRAGPHIHDAFPDRHTAPLRMEGGRAKLRIFLDASIIELYADDGESTLTDRFFPAGPLTWTASARGGTATLRTLDAWTLGKR